ncbi:MAG: hypothetical protein IK075_10295 [Prevotella sp.]|nr:hypothetical protein [Prevotella sp.]
MKYYNRLLLILFLMSALTVSAQQNVNMKFGKPTKEEMEMTVYSPDPDAEAVVLCRLTDVEYTVQTSSFLVDYREKCRIKVLKPNGVRFAKVVVPYQMNMSVGNNITGLRTSFMTIPMDRVSGNSSFQEQDGPMSEGVFGTDGDEMVEDIKAVAFNQEGSKLVKTSLKKSDIVKTKIDEQNYLVEFTVPNVKVGTVIEYEYNIHSQLFWELRDWYAQCEIPVVYAKLDMNIPNYLIFNIEDHGIQRLTYTCTVGSLKYKVESDPLANPMSVNTNHYIYVGSDLIGMPKDDYVWNAQDYWAGITAELKQYRLRGMNQLDYAKTWEQIDDMILNSDDLGLHLNDHSPLASELKASKVEEISDLRERVATVYQLVMGKVKWNGKYELSPALTSETLKKGEGSNADINILLIQSLHDAGLNAAPVMLRTRDLGLLPYNFPSIRKLSTFLVGVILPTGGNVYLDASSKNGYLNVLPEVMLVERARLVQKGNKSQWVNLQKLQRSQKNTVINVTLTPDGKLSGKQTTRYEGLAAAQYREKAGINEFTPEANEEVELSLQGDVSDGKITVCPFKNPPLENNPFNASKRLMPVEFPCISTERIVINITLPEGYTMESKPQNTIVSTPDKGLDGRYVTSETEGKAHVQYLFNVNSLSHSEKNYSDLRQIFEMFINYGKTPLIFKKKG